MVTHIRLIGSTLNIGAGQFADLASPGAGAVDHHRSVDLAFGGPDRGDLVAGLAEAGDVAFEFDFDTHLADGGFVAAEEFARVAEAVVFAESRHPDIIEADVRGVLRDLARFEQLDIQAE